jgi:major intracellular serine protease
MGEGPGVRWLLLALLLALTACAGSVSAPTTPSAATPPPPSPSGNQVMVTLPPAPPALWARTTADLAQMYRLRTVFAWTMASLGEQCIVFEIPKGRSIQEILRRLDSDPRVGTVQTIATFDVLADSEDKSAYNDPYVHLQHSVQTLHLEQAHHWSTGKGIRIAVIDTGVDLDHPDLRGRIVKAQSFVDRGEQTFTSDIHGTAVAGVIAAAADNQVGIVGVAPQAELFALKACWQTAPGKREAVCDSYTLARAIDFAVVQGAQILNFSLGGPRDPLLARLLEKALSRGIAVVAADPGDAAHGFPASLQGVIGVVGIPGGTSGNTEEMGAPGVDILTTVPHGSYDFFTGSSFAAAQVSGVVALLLQREPKMTPTQLAALLRKTAHPVQEQTGADPLQVDACAALASALGTGACP